MLRRSRAVIPGRVGGPKRRASRQTLYFACVLEILAHSAEFHRRGEPLLWVMAAAVFAWVLFGNCHTRGVFKAMSDALRAVPCAPTPTQRRRLLASAFALEAFVAVVSKGVDSLVAILRLAAVSATVGFVGWFWGRNLFAASTSAVVAVWSLMESAVVALTSMTVSFSTWPIWPRLQTATVGTIGRVCQVTASAMSAGVAATHGRVEGLAPAALKIANKMPVNPASLAVGFVALAAAAVSSFVSLENGNSNFANVFANGQGLASAIGVSVMVVLAALIAQASNGSEGVLHCADEAAESEKESRPRRRTRGSSPASVGRRHRSFCVLQSEGIHRDASQSDVKQTVEGGSGLDCETDCCNPHSNVIASAEAVASLPPTSSTLNSAAFTAPTAPPRRRSRSPLSRSAVTTMPQRSAWQRLRSPSPPPLGPPILAPQKAPVMETCVPRADSSDELFAEEPSTIKLKASADFKDMIELSEDTWTVSSTLSAVAGTMSLLVRTGSLSAVAQTIRERRRRAFAGAASSPAIHVDSASW